MYKLLQSYLEKTTQGGGWKTAPFHQIVIELKACNNPNENLFISKNKYLQGQSISENDISVVLGVHDQLNTTELNRFGIGYLFYIMYMLSCLQLISWLAPQTTIETQLTHFKRNCGVHIGHILLCLQGFVLNFNFGIYLDHIFSRHFWRMRQY